jgi:hypothetical protein
MYGLSRGVCSLKCYGTRLLHLTLTQPRAARTMSGMGYKVKDAWHHWTYTSAAGYADQVAGYATNYDVSSLGNVRIMCSACVVTLCCSVLLSCIVNHIRALYVYGCVGRCVRL